MNDTELRQLFIQFHNDCINQDDINPMIDNAIFLLAARDRRLELSELKRFHNWITKQPQYQNITLHTMQQYWDLHHKTSWTAALGSTDKREAV